MITVKQNPVYPLANKVTLRLFRTIHQIIEFFVFSLFTHVARTNAHIVREQLTQNRTALARASRLALGTILCLGLSTGAYADPDAVVELPLDEGSGVVAHDVSGMGNDGELLNGAMFDANTPDGSPNAVRLDGVDDSIDLGSVDVNGSSLSLAAWFNASSFPGPSRDPRLISKASGTAANAHVFMLSTIKVGAATRLRARVRVGGATTTLKASSGDVMAGVWHHAALTYDGAVLRLYLDGLEVGSTPLSGAVDMDPDMPVAVGAQPDGAGDRFFDGLLDDVRILQRALSAAEVADIAQPGGGLNQPPTASATATPSMGDAPLNVSFDGSGSTDPDGTITGYDWDFGDGNSGTGATATHTYTNAGTYTAQLTVTDDGGAQNSTSVTISVTSTNADPDAVVELPLDEGSGVVAHDVSGMGNDGLLLHGAVFEANTADGSPYTVRLDGVDDSIDLGSVDVNGSGLSLAAWFNASSFPGPSRDPRLISKASGTAANSHVFMLSTIKVGAATRLRARVRVGGATTTLKASGGDVMAGVWHHAALTYDGTVLRLYLDGLEVGSTPLSGVVDMDPDMPVAVGAQPDGAGDRFFDGLLDDVRILQRALSVAEIAAISAGNQPPVAGNDGYITPEDTALSVNAANGVLANDTDPELDPLQAQLVDDVTNGILTLNTDGSFDYTPNQGFSGTDSFTYRANDGLVDSNLATVTIAVGAPPTAVDDVYSVDEDTVLAVAAMGVLENDIDTNPPADLTAVLVTGPAHGALTNFAADGAFMYTPNLNFNGVDSFTYEAVDGGNGTTALATVTITVNALNDPPVAADDAVAVEPNTSSFLDVDTVLLANDDDVDGDSLSLDSFTLPANGTLLDNGDGTLTYTPDTDFTGIDNFTYTATDGASQSNTANVLVTVDSANDAPQIVTGTIFFTKQTIDDTVDETHFAVAADFDGDNDIDVAATDYIDDMVFWYENNGSNSFVKHTVDNDLEGAYPTHVADVDMDGDTDVLATGYLADTVVWYENDGSGNFTRHDVDTAADGAHSVVTEDMDQDGDIDLLTTSQDAGTVTWYENDGSLFFTKHTIDNFAIDAKRADFADIDGDGDFDVVSASFAIDEIAWYENDGNENFTKRLVDTIANGAYFVFVTSVDSDSHIDILAASQNDDTIAWYKNDGNGNFIKQTIDTNADGARAVIAADVDGDGDNDALSTSVNDDTIAWYQNDGNGGFSAQAIDGAADGAYGVFTIDMDHDGDIDVLSASRDADTVAVHLQIKVHAASLAKGDTLVIDEGLLLTTDTDDGPTALTYTITSTPAFGELWFDGTVLSDGATFTQDDINNNRVYYVHDGSDSSSDMFAFTVADGGENGVKPASGTFTFNITGIDPIADMVVDLPLDESSGSLAEDVSGMGNDGTLLNGAAFEANSPDGSPFAVRFDGVDDLIDLGPLDVNGSGLTLAVWFNADRFPGSARDPRLISKASGTAANDHVFMLGTIKVGTVIRLRARVRVGGVTTTLIATAGDLVPGIWQHTALTYDGAVLRLYLDGLEVGSTPLSGAVDTEPGIPVAVGAQPPGAGGRYFDGLLDDVRILQRALNASEIAAITAGATSGGN